MELILLALAGCIGAAVAASLLAARWRRLHGRAVPAVFLLTLAVTVSGAALWLKPSFPALGIGSMAKELADSLPLAALREHDPELWVETVTQLRAHAHHGQTREDAASVVKSGLYYVMRRKISVSSNEAAVRFISARMDELEHYARQGEELCYMLMAPPPGLVFLKAAKPPASLRQQLDSTMIEVIRDAALNPQPAPTEADVVPLLEMWSRETPPAAPTTSASRPAQCLATVQATRRMLERPVGQAGLFLRMMYGLPQASRRD